MIGEPLRNALSGWPPGFGVPGDEARLRGVFKTGLTLIHNMDKLFACIHRHICHFGIGNKRIFLPSEPDRIIIGNHINIDIGTVTPMHTVFDHKSTEITDPDPAPEFHTFFFQVAGDGDNARPDHFTG